MAQIPGDEVNAEQSSKTEERSPSVLKADIERTRRRAGAVLERVEARVATFFERAPLGRRLSGRHEAGSAIGRMVASASAIAQARTLVRKWGSGSRRTRLLMIGGTVVAMGLLFRHRTSKGRGRRPADDSAR